MMLIFRISIYKETTIKEFDGVKARNVLTIDNE